VLSVDMHRMMALTSKMLSSLPSSEIQPNMWINFLGPKSTDVSTWWDGGAGDIYFLL